MNTRRQQRIQRVVAQRQNGIIVVLEDIHDPHNSAAILRTCDAMGIQNVWYIFENEEAYNPVKVGKATSSSANKWLDFHIFSSTRECIRALKKSGYHVIVSALSDDSVSLEDYRCTEKKVAIFVGNEHRGISDEALTHADTILKIPMLGFVQSLNVSVAAAMMLWEITKQRRQSKTPQMLNKKDHKALLNDFLERAKK